MNKSIKISKETKNEVRELYKTGRYVKRQLSEMFNLKFNTIVKIIRTI